MVTLANRIATRTLPQPRFRASQGCWRALAHRRLTEVFATAKRVNFDDSSRIILFSDCHRGNNGRLDDFAHNEPLFYHTLSHYYREGFTYIEVGDGDDLWKHRRFSDVRKAHGRIFDLLHMFDHQNRLHLIAGNHDFAGSRHSQVEKDGIVTLPGLVLRYARTGQRVFVVHGHQADFKSEQLLSLSRFAVRHIWRWFQLLGFGNGMVHKNHSQRQKGIDRRISAWAQAHRRVTICGHTHRPLYPSYGEPPYFNIGSCVAPGTITGLEIQSGELIPIEWSTHPEATETPHIERRLAAEPRKLHRFL